MMTKRNRNIKNIFIMLQMGHETWKCVDPELERQIRCFPDGERSNIPRFQQVKQKAVGGQRNLGLRGLLQFFFIPRLLLKNHKGGISNVKFIFMQHFFKIVLNRVLQIL
jgi:hypothetical protein